MLRLTAILLTLFSINVSAEEIVAPAPNAAAATEKREAVVNQRQENQDKRTEEGVKSGALTEKEANRMEKREQHVQKMENKAMADGKMTGKEFRKIERAQNRASRAIHRNKHDGQRR